MFRKVTYLFPAFTSTYESKKARKHTVLFATWIVRKEGVKKFASILTLFYEPGMYGDEYSTLQHLFTMDLKSMNIRILLILFHTTRSPFQTYSSSKRL